MMPDPDQSEPRHEAHADSTAEPETDGDVSAPVHALRRRQRTTIVVGAVIAVVLVGIAAVIGGNRYNDRAPVRAVESYLEAVQAGDVAAALEHFDDPPRTVGAHFLTPEALNQDWDVDDVSLENLVRYDSLDDQATVEATISAANEASVSGHIELERIDGEWLITDGLSRMSVSFTQLPMIEVNGFNPGLGPGTADNLTFFLFPGLYEYYSEGVEGVEPAVRSQLVLGSEVDVVEVAADLTWVPEDAVTSVNPQVMTLSEDATELLQSKVESYLDDCFADIDGESEYGCPIGTSSTRIAQTVDSDSFVEVSEMEWELVEYPHVEAYLEDDPGSVSEIQLRVETAGTTGLTADVNGESVYVECPLPVTFIQPHFDLNGELFLGPREERDGVDVNTLWHADAPDWRDCVEP